MKNISIKVFIFTFLVSACLAHFGKAFAEENQLKDVIKMVMPATVLVMTFDVKGKPLTQGSGFFVSETGELITNYHVFKDAESIEVKCPDNSVYKITLVIAEDLTSDLVKLQADTGGKKVPWLPLNKAKIEVGEKIVVIGSPKGLEATVSDGIVSAVRDVPGFGNIIQITAPISPGSSGSAVVNMKGEVIGVASAQMIEGQNLNFVVPAEKITALKEKKQSIATSKPKGVAKKSNDIYSAAFAYYLTKDYEKALPLFEQYLIKNKGDAETWLKAGWCYRQLGRYQEAIEAYKQAIRLKPNLVEAHFNIGVIYESFLQRYQEAIEADKQAIRLKPDWEVAHDNIGDVYEKSGRYQESIGAYKQAIRLNPDYVEAYCGLGNVYGRRLGRWQEAIKAWKQVITLMDRDSSSGLESQYTWACIEVGYAYAKLGRWQEANEAFKQYIRLKSPQDIAYWQLGDVYVELGRYPEAIEAYKQAIRLSPNSVWPHFNLGLAYLEIGDKGSALEEYKILKTLNPERANELFNLIYK